MVETCADTTGDRCMILEATSERAKGADRSIRLLVCTYIVDRCDQRRATYTHSPLPVLVNNIYYRTQPNERNTKKEKQRDVEDKKRRETKLTKTKERNYVYVC